MRTTGQSPAHTAEDGGEFIVLGIRLQPEPLVPCLNCDCHDPDMGCTMPSIDKSYACPLVSCDDEQTEVLDE